MLIKLADALEVEMWELFDFGHEVNIKELRDTINKLLKELIADGCKNPAGGGEVKQNKLTYYLR